MTLPGFNPIAGIGRRPALLCAWLILLLLGSQNIGADGIATPARPIIIGLDADLSSGSARSGEAIRRGMELATYEINAAGGLLGRRLEILAKDHRGNPTRGIDNINDFADNADLVAVIGGLHTTVVLEELDSIQTRGLPWISAWASGEGIIENGFNPSYAFRLGVTDRQAADFLALQAQASGFVRPALVYENTGWGRAMDALLSASLRQLALAPVAQESFYWGQQSMHGLLEAVSAARADVVLLAANAPEGLHLVSAMAALDEARRIPLLAHFAITGGGLFELGHDALGQVDLRILQTYSFIEPDRPQHAATVIADYMDRYPDALSAADIFAPMGTANAFDAVHLLARAIRRAGSTDRYRIREALEQLEPYAGLVQDYAPPFTPARHQVADGDAMWLSRYDALGRLIRIP